MLRTSTGRSARAAAAGLATACLAALGIAGAVAQEIPKLHLTCNTMYAHGTVLSRTVHILKEEIEAKSKGRITVEAFDSGALFKGGEEPEALGGGISDCGSITSAYYRGTYPVMADGMYLPFGLSPTMSSDITNIPVLSEIVAAEFAKTNIVPLFGAPSPQGFYFIKPLADGGAPAQMEQLFKDRKVRGFGPWNDGIRMLGGTAVSFPAPEIPIALRQGTMAGLVTANDNWRNLGIFEDVPFGYVFQPALEAPHIIGMNKKKFDSLPPHVQALIKDAAMSASQRYLKAILDETADVLNAARNNPKITLTVLSGEQRQRWIQALEPLWTGFAARGEMHKKWIDKLRELQAEGDNYVPSWKK